MLKKIIKKMGFWINGIVINVRILIHRLEIICIIIKINGILIRKIK